MDFEVKLEFDSDQQRYPWWKLQKVGDRLMIWCVDGLFERDVRNIQRMAYYYSKNHRIKLTARRKKISEEYHEVGGKPIKKFNVTVERLT